MENKSQTTLYGKDAIEAAIKKGNINIAGAMQVTVMDLNEESKESQLVHAETLKKFETKKRARAIIVPTSIEEIKENLRELGHPVTLFGEGPADRRERLREVIAALNLNDEELKRMQDTITQATQTTVPGSASLSSSSSQQLQPQSADATKSMQKEVFYSNATEAMINMRKYLCDYSFAKAHNRISILKKIRDDDEEQLIENRHALALYKTYKHVILNSSQYGDDRPLSCIRYSPYGDVIATGSLNSTVKLWDVNDLQCMDTIRGHEDRITSVAWHPDAFKSSSSSSSSSSFHSKNKHINDDDDGGDNNTSGNNNSTTNNSDDADGSSSSRHGLLATTSAGNVCNIWKCHYINSNSSNINNNSNNTNSSNERMDIENNHNNNSNNNNNNNNTNHLSNSINKNNSSDKGSGSNSMTTALQCQLVGHQGGLTNCEFHPSGKLIGTSSYDFTWRLWDVETSAELLLQDGHIKECSSITFQCDGSLACTTDYAGVALVWDLRSGQQIQSFQGHVKKITNSMFNPNGYQIVTGGTDNTVRIWDLRKRKCLYVLPAHLNIISDVRLSKSGELMITSSFDGSMKIWNTRNFKLLQTLYGHVGKVMSCDFSNDEKHVLSAGFDRTIKYWAHKDEY